MSLVLTRQPGEAIYVGDALVRFDMQGKRIRVAIDAPRDVSIAREEVRKRKVAEQQAEAGPTQSGEQAA